MLASLSDIRKWLPHDKLPPTDLTVAGFQVEANRIIRGMLSGVFKPTTLFAWDTPDNTPGTIRTIAAKLIAAFVYRAAYSEDVPDVPHYAQTLYNEAIGDLNNIRSGALTVLDSNDNPIEDNLLEMSASDFYPNNAAPGPFFSMETEFA